MFAAQLGIFLACGLCASCATLTTTPQQGCVMRGVHYNVDPWERVTFKPSRCEFCTCPQDGQPSCVIMDCMHPPCADAVYVHNDCCPVCPNGPNCRVGNGPIIKDNEQYKPDPHTTCECRSWGMGGTRAVCVSEPPTPAPLPLCERNGVHYHVGESFHPSPCEDCYCHIDGKATCINYPCPILDNYCVDAVHDPTKCCPDCPNGPNCKHTDGTIIKQGEQYKPDSNTTCECPQNVYGMQGAMALCVPQPVTPLTQVQLIG